jgi:hypothetical protein
MKITIHSIFWEHYNALMGINCSVSLKQAIWDLTSSSGIKEIDKRKIYLDVKSLETLEQIQLYLTNSMLKYQGLGVSH